MNMEEALMKCRSASQEIEALRTIHADRQCKALTPSETGLAHSWRNTAIVPRTGALAPSNVLLKFIGMIARSDPVDRH